MRRVTPFALVQRSSASVCVRLRSLRPHSFDERGGHRQQPYVRFPLCSSGSMAHDGMGDFHMFAEDVNAQWVAGDCGLASVDQCVAAQIWLLFHCLIVTWL